MGKTETIIVQRSPKTLVSAPIY